MPREKRDWSDEVRLRLIIWSAWVAGPQVYQSPGNPIAAMIKRAAGELQGDDISVPRELTFELEVTEKAIARMKQSGFRRDTQARKLLQQIYQYTIDVEEIARDRKWSPEMLRIQQWRAESIVGRYMMEVEKDLKNIAMLRQRA